jgi:CspA family cold shock protein
MSENNTSETPQQVEQSVEKTIGMVKWFDNHAGYGFISYGNDDNDVFCHYSNVNRPNENTFRTLTKGEYVEFELQKCTEENKLDKDQAVNISGLNGGPLLSESNPHLHRRRRGPFRRDEGEGDDTRDNRGNDGGHRGGYRGNNNRDNNGGGGKWSSVVKRDGGNKRRQPRNNEQTEVVDNE